MNFKHKFQLKNKIKKKFSHIIKINKNNIKKKKLIIENYLVFKNLFSTFFYNKLTQQDD